MTIESDLRYRRAVQRNIDAYLLNCRRNKQLFCYSVKDLLRILSQSGTMHRMGIREADRSFDVQIQNLRCAILAAWVLYRYPDANVEVNSREWMGHDEFATMDGGERMHWISRFEIGLLVLEGKPPATFDAGFYSWV